MLPNVITDEYLRQIGSITCDQLGDPQYKPKEFENVTNPQPVQKQQGGKINYFKFYQENKNNYTKLTFSYKSRKL